MSLRGRLLVYLLAFFIPVSLGLNALVYNQSRKLLERDVQKVLEEISQNTMRTLDMLFFERRQDVLALATDPDLASSRVDPAVKSKRLRVFQEKSKAYISLSIFTMDRVRVADTAGIGLGVRHSGEIYWKEIERGQDPAFDMYLSEPAMKPVFILATKLADPESGQESGVLVARIATSEIDKVIELIEGLHSGGKDLFKTGALRVSLVNRSGIIIYSNMENADVLKETSPHWPLVKRKIEEDQSRNHGAVYQKDRIITYAVEDGYRDFTGNGWTLILDLDRGVVHENLEALEKKLIIALLASFLAGVAAVVLVARTITRPVERLAEAAKSVSQGDYHSRTGIVESGEIGDLAGAFDRMVELIQKNRAELEEYTRGLEREIEAKNQAQAALVRAKEEAEEANRIKDSFMSLLSHDLRSPLATIYSFVSLVEESESERLSEVARNGLAIIRRNSRSLLDQISTLLDNSLIKHGKISPKPASAGLNELALRSYALVEQAAREKRVEFVLAGLERQITTDAFLLGRVLHNIFHNAIKFSHPGGKVWVEYHGGENPRITVADEGLGVPPEMAGSLFDLARSTSRKGTSGERGSGLGLPLCQEIMKAMGGRIGYSPREGGGSEFCVFLPPG